MIYALKIFIVIHYTIQSKCGLDFNWSMDKASIVASIM